MSLSQNQILCKSAGGEGEDSNLQNLLLRKEPSLRKNVFVSAFSAVDSPCGATIFFISLFCPVQPIACMQLLLLSNLCSMNSETA